MEAIIETFYEAEILLTAAALDKSEKILAWCRSTRQSLKFDSEVDVDVVMTHWPRFFLRSTDKTAIQRDSRKILNYLRKFKTPMVDMRCMKTGVNQ